MKNLTSKRPVTIKLFAGLGNQLFQYAYGKYLASKGNNVRFLLSPGLGSITDVFELNDPTVMEVKSRYYSGLIKAWAKYINRSYLTGFFQEAGFTSFAGLTKNQFKRKSLYDNTIYPAILGQGETVAVHIRGGDYLRGNAIHQYGSVCTAFYYKKAFDHIKSKFSKAEFFVFTDDQEYAREVLKTLDLTYNLVFKKTFEKDPGFDLYLMTLCRHHIIANSTFSYWGAVLGQEREGIVIYPDKWTSDNTVDMKNLVPKTWTVINTAPNNLDTELRQRYARMNNSFKRQLVFHLGKNAGFFSEFNNMILAMLYCLEQQIKFVLYSKNANFRTKNGWSDFFLPFCPETDDDFHRKWNYRWLKIYHPHKKAFVWVYKKIKGLDLLTHDVWRKFKNINFAKGHFVIPELGIDGDVQEACRVLHKIVWQYNDETWARVEPLKQGFIPEKPYLAVQLRGGDKSTEHQVYSPWQYARKLRDIDGPKRAFVLTDDYRLFLELRDELPGWQLITSCDESQTGYVHGDYMKQNLETRTEKLLRLFAAMDILSEAVICVVSFTANPGMNLGMRMSANAVIGVDYPEWKITW